MIFDTHIHLNDKKIYENLDFYIQDALNKGVKKFLCVGYDLESSKIAIEIANKYHEVYASIGIIPTEYKTEILCYEFKGKVETQEFLVYINAENGREEDILVITNTPNGTLAM